MADERGLMRPLRADSLKPRPSTQAVWEPDPDRRIAAEPPAPEPETAPIADQPAEEAEPEWFAEEFLPDQDAQPLMDVFRAFAPEVRFEPLEQPEEEPEPEPEPAAPQEEEPFDLDAVIAAILAQDEDDEDELLGAQDALPTEKMPQPAFVPLEEFPAAKPKRRGWLWIAAAAAVAAAAGCAAVLSGWLR